MDGFSRWLAAWASRLRRWFRDVFGGPPRDHQPNGDVGIQPRPPLTFTLPIPPELAKTLDPHLGLAWSLIGTGDWAQLKSRFGIDQQSKFSQSLPLFIDFGSRAIGNDVLRSELIKLNLSVPEFYYKERESNKALTTATARIALVPGDPSQVQDREGGSVPLDKQLLAILQNSLIRRISIARSHQPCLRDSIRDIGMLPGRKHKGHTLSGDGIVIGIIDDGCAFAHRHFLKTVGNLHRTRVRRLWDQSVAPSTADLAVGWKKPAVPFNAIPTLPPAVPYGRELTHSSIDLAIAANVSPDGQIDEDAIYEALNYQVGEPGNLASHGTHVMDIAAGNGHSLLGTEGVAPGAEIIFVQLPVVDINLPGPALDQHIVDGVAYIFSKAGAKPAVVNISYGGYSGPHDGTSAWEAQIDALIASNDNRAVVVSAGNGFEAECHASGTIAAGSPPRELHWIIRPEDSTHNDMEIWYDGAATLTIELKEPETGHVYGAFPLGTHLDIAQPPDGRTIGRVDHSQPGSNGDSSILVTLRPTLADDGNATLAPARSGEWIVRLTNSGSNPAPFHAWIQRDDIGPTGGRRQQSRFAPNDVDPRFTIADFATGQHTIAVGAYNARTHEIARYSACGPTRRGSIVNSRRKPDICAPAAEDAAGRGVLSASSLRAMPTRMGGTSASAPHVTGLVALIFEYSMKHGAKTIHADAIRASLAAAVTSRLHFNRHQEADDNVGTKQSGVWADVIGAGRIDFATTMRKLFP
jgi:subtilisin family serine protease